MVPRIPSALPSESSRRAINAPRQGWYESRQLHRCSRYPAQIFQWTGGGWYTQFSWQAVTISILALRVRTAPNLVNIREL